MPGPLYEMVNKINSHLEDILSATFANHETYFAIAKDNLSKAVELEQERNAKTTGQGITDNDVDWICEKNAQIERVAIVSVVFSALTAEAFINHYAVVKLSKSYLEKYLDKLDPVAKWIVIPRMITGKSIDPGSLPIQRLGSLVTLRNKLVHYKTRTKIISQIKDSDWVSVNDARNGVETIRGLIEALKDIDDSVETEWIGNG